MVGSDYESAGLASSALHASVQDQPHQSIFEGSNFNGMDGTGIFDQLGLSSSSSRKRLRTFSVGSFVLPARSSDGLVGSDAPFGSGGSRGAGAVSGKRAYVASTSAARGESHTRDALDGTEDEDADREGDGHGASAGESGDDGRGQSGHDDGEDEPEDGEALNEDQYDEEMETDENDTELKLYPPSSVLSSGYGASSAHSRGNTLSLLESAADEIATPVPVPDGISTRRSSRGRQSQ
jgi:hypothetical protein